MSAQEHLKNVLANLNRYEHWTNELHQAVRDAEVFLDQREIDLDTAARNIDKDLGRLDEMATLVPEEQR
jgi:hypothetical protein